MNVTIKQLRDKKWEIIPLEKFKGRKPGELLMSFDGTDTVCEVTTDIGKAFFCGTARWMDAMRAKGPVMLCRDAALFYPDHKGPLEKIIDIFGDVTDTSESKPLTIEPSKRETQLELKEGGDE